MIKILSKFIFSLCILSLSVSFCLADSEDKINLSKVEDYSLMPARVFLLKNKLFLDFNVENLFLTVKLSKKGKNNTVKRLKLDAEKIKNKKDKIKEIHIIPNDLYLRILNEALINFNINKNITTLQYEYENSLGDINNIYSEFTTEKKSPLNKKNIKKEIQLDKELSEKFLQEIINSSRKYSSDNQFLIAAKNMSGIVYIFIDVEKSYILPLILPPYQKNKENLNFLSMTTDFFYSFLIKNHIVPIIKSPFTSSYRLFSSFSSALLTFSPNISDDYYKNPINNAEMMDIDNFNKFLDEDLGTKQYKAKIKILIDGEEFFNDFMNAAKNAVHSIFIQSYIFKNDDFSKMVADCLKEYSKTVDIRVLVDYMGTIEVKKPSKDILYQNYALPKDINAYLEKDSNIKVRVHPDTWVTSDHRKVFLIDKKKAYLGGMNIANEYRYVWHDLMISLEGPIVSKLLKDFYKAWSFAGIGGDFAVAYRSIFTKSQRTENQPSDDMIDIRLLTTSSTDYQIHSAQLEAIRRAKNRIYIENPYFSETTLINELINAKKRGVDVKIIFPEVNDIVMSDKINLKVANYLIENEIEVYLYPKMTHVKAAVYDNWCCVGSANFNRLSMFKNKEVNIAFYDKNTIDELINKLFLPDIENSKRYNEKVDVPFIYYIM